MRRSYTWAFSLLALTTFTFLLIFLSCTREHENPLDPANPEPFDLRAQGLVGRIRLVWNIPSVPDLESTVIYKQDTRQDTTTFLEIIRVTCPESVYVDWDVTPDVLFNYRVASFAQGDYSRQSDIDGATPRSVSSPFSLVVIDHPADQGRCLDISWAPSPMDTTGGEITGYIVKRDTVLEGSYSPLDTTGTGVTEFNDCGLSPGVLYYYKVSALAGSIESEDTGVRSARALDNIAPSPPQSVMASDYPADQGTAITVIWTLSPDDGSGADDVTLYQIFRSVELDTSAVYSIGTAQAGDTLFLDQDLEPGDMFYYRVRAKDSGNTSAYSVADSATAVDNGAPGSPGGLLALNPSPDGGGKIQLLWQKSPDDNGGGGLEGYKVYRTVDQGVYGEHLASLPTGSSEHIDSTVVDLIDYYYVVSAYDGNLESTPSNEAGPVAADDELPPASVNDFQATPGQTEGEVELTWTAPGDDGNVGRASAYTIKFAQDSIATNSDWDFAQMLEAGQIPDPSVAGTQENITVTGMPPWNEIWFSLKAKDDRENHSSLSNSASTEAQYDVTAPAPIEDLYATNEGVTEGQIRLVWPASGDDGTSGTASNYLIKISLNQIRPQDFETIPDTLPNPPQPQPSGSQEEYIVTGLTPDVLYYFMLKVTDDAGNSALSNSANVRAQVDVTSPAAITSLTAIGDSQELIESQILLTWEAPGDDADSGGVVTSYDFRYSTNLIDDETSWNGALSLDSIVSPPRMYGPGEPDSLIADGFTEGQTYYFACKAKDEIGLESELSNSPGAAPQVDVTPPGRIMTLEATGDAEDLVEGQIRLRWIAPADDGYSGETVTGYEFKYAMQGFERLSPEEWWIDAADLDTILEGPEFSPPEEDDSLTAGGLPAGELLYFACKAIDDHQRESTVSNCAWDTVQTDVTPPAKITTLDVSTGSWQGWLEVVWEAVADDSNFVDSGRAAEYDLRYSKLGEINSTNWESATQWPNVPSPPAEPGARDSVEIRDLDFDEVYYVALKVRDKVGNWSVISNCDWAPSGADTQAPSDVSAFEVEEDDEILYLSWSEPAHSYPWEYEGVLIAKDTFEITTNPVPNGDYHVGDFLLPPDRVEIVYMDDGESWNDPDVVNGTTYYYRAYSYDEARNYSEGDTSQDSGTPADTTPPSPVTDFIAEQIPEGIRLSWTCPSDVDFESVKIVYGLADYPSSHDDGTELTIELGEPGEPDTTLHASPVEQTYYYAAFARDEVPNHSTAKTDSATYDVTSPQAVGHMELTPGEQSITLSWANPIDPDRNGIIVLRHQDTAVEDLPEQGEDYAGETEIGTSDVVVILGPGVAGETEYEDTDLTSGTTYHYSIQTFDWRFNYSGQATGEAIPD